MPPQSGFKGNKAALPSKICVTCGRVMTWRKSWAKNWAEVKYCSDACRAKKPKDALKKLTDYNLDRTAPAPAFARTNSRLACA